MTRNLKALGLSLVALVAVSAIAASAAQAGSLDVGANPAWLTAEQAAGLAVPKLTLTASGLVVKCQAARLEATTQAANVQEATAIPSYSDPGCTFGGTSMTVDVNGCKYTITGAGEPALTAKLDIVGCESGKHLTVTQGTCELTIPEQNGLSHVVFSNVAGSKPTHAVISVTFQGITYEGDTGCGVNVQGLHHDADLNGETTLKAFQDINGIEGAQVSLEAT
jgi:hypothetical protein